MKNKLLQSTIYAYFLILIVGQLCFQDLKASEGHDYNNVSNAKAVATSMINNPKRDVIGYVVKSSVVPDHSLSKHTESYFYTDDPQVLSKIVREVIQNATSSKDNVQSRNKFELHKVFSPQEAKQLVGRDFIGHDGRAGKDTNRVVVVIDIGGLKQVKDETLKQKGILWMGGNIDTAFPEEQ